MSINSHSPHIHLQSPLNTSSLYRTHYALHLHHHHRPWRRRRLKSTRRFFIRNFSTTSFHHNFIQTFISNFPSVNSLDVIAPALGLASGIALYLSQLNSNRNSTPHLLEWKLFASPTPFNRFVALRCPSLNGGELQGVIHVKDGNGSDGDDVVVYQRICVGTEDGGVVALDWPENLELTEEHGLDTTVLLVPGTVEGSMDRDVISFVCECLKRGCFPVVMNPRGCGGSPLTTPRLFTAADSDDVYTAIQFINKARPWTTSMAVGWGYGASMLTKYLTDVREKTPLTAATCIDNPFDLEEATSSSPYGLAVDQKLTAGLIDILLSNKNDDGTVPLFSVPRSSIAENPFTSLLMCSCLPSSMMSIDRSTISWCQQLTLEWLTAVEFGLLKGRHPLLEDVDVTINPSKGLVLREVKTSTKPGTVSNTPNFPQSHSFNANSLYALKAIHSSSGEDPKKSYNLEDNKWQQQTNGSLQQNSSADAESVEEEGVGPVEGERGQVVQTAEVVMNMLDMTVPDTLTEEQKKKVLTAVSQGETLVNALQGAVPEDVREKLTTAVSGILKNQRNNLKFDGLLSIGHITDVATGLKSKIQEKVGLSSSDTVAEDLHTSHHKRTVHDMADGSNMDQPSTDKPSRGLESETWAAENSEKSFDSGQLQSTSNSGSDVSSAGMGNADLPREYSENKENWPETGAKLDFSREAGEAAGSEDKIVDQSKVEQGFGIAQSERENIIQQQEVKDAESSADPSDAMPLAKIEDKLSPSTSSSETTEGSENQNRELKSAQPVQSSSDTPSFSVSQAFDALTGLDDSTQVAVNSVFNVIEDMITQLEVEKDDIEVKTVNENPSKASVTEDHRGVDDCKLEKKGDSENGMLLPSNESGYSPGYDRVNSTNDSRAIQAEETPVVNPNLFGENMIGGFGKSNLGGHVGDGSTEESYMVYSKLLEKSDKLRLADHIPLSIATNPYGDPLFKEFLRKYLTSKMNSTKQLDLDTTTALFLDYFPEEGQWKLLEQTGHNKDSVGDQSIHEDFDKMVQPHLPHDREYANRVIEPSNVILDAEKQHEPVRQYEQMNITSGNIETGDGTTEKLLIHVKSIILDALKVEVQRRPSAIVTAELEPTIARDLEHVANTVAQALGHGKEHIMSMAGSDHTSEQKGTLYGEHIISAITAAVDETTYLKRILPIGVIVGTSLAALREVFTVAAADGNGQSKIALDLVDDSGQRNGAKAGDKETDQQYDIDNSISRENSESNNDGVMAGAVAAALGASTLLAHQQDSCKDTETVGTYSKSSNERKFLQEPRKDEEDISEKTQSNMVSSLAEKAMSVAGPVVPTKQGGEVDQERSDYLPKDYYMSFSCFFPFSLIVYLLPPASRLVALLTELGQKGGMLRLVGKVALLWGGIRGAMSLTDKLIIYLRFAERPLPQRILGFVCMVLVLWTPVIVPLLPTLVQSWASHKPFRIAELACIIGLYTSIMILVTLWGKRIRGYEIPLQQYGLDFTTPSKFQNLLKGFIGGVMLVLSIQSINALIGSVHLSWPSSPASLSSDAVTRLKVFGQMVILFGRGITTAIGVALVEELLFRSWLADEIAADLGYHRGVIISGFAFSVCQRSPWAIPGLWLLSLALAGARQKSQGVKVNNRGGCEHIRKESGILEPYLF
ncbi:hypothetical protein RJ640_009177 [Escallonia rubra]|uniref:Embryogenesis-associated protein EMB8 n=1 Tax=Escallonia rubra TaxID=112253 RepID=A0AA88UW43_9ASTE|nr:hypothetical protein RJ640_009177 [Escallonia rubra]